MKVILSSSCATWRPVQRLLRRARPTAVNLDWGLKRVLLAVRNTAGDADEHAPCGAFGGAGAG